MFGFLKEKLKSAVSSFSKKAQEEGKEEEKPVEDVSAPLPQETAAAEPQAPTHSTEPSFEPVSTESDQAVQKINDRIQEEPQAPEKKGLFSSIKSIFSKSSEEPKKEETEAQEGPKEETTQEQVPQEEAFHPEPLQAEPLQAEIPQDTSLDNHPPSTQQEEIPAKVKAQETEVELAQDNVSVPTPIKEPFIEDKTHDAKPQPAPVASAPLPLKTHEAQKKSISQKHATTQKSTSLPKPSLLTQPKSATAPKPVAPSAPIPAATAPAQSDEKKGFFSSLKEKILTTTISEKQFEEMFFDLELAMLENNVASEVVEKIRNDLRQSIVDKPIARSAVENRVHDSLRDSLKGLFIEPFDLVSHIKGSTKRPYVISFIGINGSGKTTSIAKITSLLKSSGLSVVLAAADTFRAASIEQLATHGERLSVKVVKHDYGADPAAVAFDAIRHAEAKGVDVVLIDTAGRMHSNQNLVDEMKKIIRVSKPDLKIFVGESITGNDCIEQARSFNEAVGIDGIILSKADIDEKGGAAVSVSYVTGKPILYFGVGQEYSDLKPFDSSAVLEQLGMA